MEAENRVNTQFKSGDPCTPDYQNGTYIVQAHEWGKYVGRADYEFRNGNLTLVNYDLIPVNLKKKVDVDGESKRVFVRKEIKPDQAMLNFLTPYEEKGQAELGVKIATINHRLEGDRHVVRFHQTNLGHLIAIAHMEKTHADFAIMNSGGVRDSIEPGQVTYKDVLKVQPFSNEITYVDMVGKDVKDYLNSVATMPVDSGAYAQFAGISMTVGDGRVLNVKIQGKPIVMDQLYRFSVPSFNAAGGDGYPNITHLPGFVNTGYVDADVLKEYLQSHSPVDTMLFEPKNEIEYR